MSGDGLEQKLKEDEAVKMFFSLAFFEPFDKHEKLELAEFDTYVVHYSKEEYIIREGGPNNCLFILLKGEVAITKRIAPDVRLATLRSGAVFGEIAFLVDPPPRITNAVTLEKTSVLRLDKEILNEISPGLQIKIKDQLLRLLVNKLDNMNKMLINHIRAV